MNIKCDTGTHPHTRKYTNTRKTKGCVAIFFTHRSMGARVSGTKIEWGTGTARAYPCAIMGLWPINALTCNDFRLNLSFFGGSSHFIHLRPHVRFCNDICTHVYKHSLCPCPLPTPLSPPMSVRACVCVCLSLRVLENKSAREQQANNTAQYAKQNHHQMLSLVFIIFTLFRILTRGRCDFTSS